MNTASLDRVKVALLRELEVTFQSYFHQHLTEVITDLRIHNVERPGVARTDEILSVIRSSGILQLMGGPELVTLRSAIERLSTGEYGLCVRCGRGIALHELEARPTTQYCSRCREVSRMHKGHSRPKMRHS
jgi:hypothetical protein